MFETQHLQYAQILPKTDLETYIGGMVEGIRAMISEIEKGWEQDEEDEDENDGNLQAKRDLKDLDNYATYLNRCLVQAIEAARSQDIDSKLSDKLHDRGRTSMPEIYHTSSSKYVHWLPKAKIFFPKQPALPPPKTGVPALRRSLYALPAHQNLKDYESYICVTVPALLHKLKRTSIDTERNAGFFTVAAEFDVVRKAFIAHFLKEVKAAFSGHSGDGLAKMKLDIISFKS